jgi:hypothetical protein
MRTAIRIKGNTYETDAIKSPFVLGIFSPKIYLPLHLSAQDREHIVLHEKTHILRRDHIVKIIAYFILCLHWFNPFAWAAFLLMGVDMEMSCDERVLKEIGLETKKEYSKSLLTLATNRRIIGGSPLAFSEGGLKERIKNVLKYRKTSRVVITVAVALVAALSIGFALNRSSSANEENIAAMPPTDGPPSVRILSGNTPIGWVVGKNVWDGAAFEHNATFQSIMSGTSFEELPYIRNGETITIGFRSSVPDSATLTEYLLRENGDMRYSISGMEYDVTLEPNHNRASFRIQPNWATGLSSYSGDYAPGNTIKGYRLVVAWGGNECEYLFIIRGDAAITMVTTENGSGGSTSQPGSTPDPGETEAIEIIGTWIAETGSVTHFYQDGTGRTEDDAGIHGFTWEVMSLTYAIEQRREFLAFGEFRVFEYLRTISYNAEGSGISWGLDDQDASDPDDWVIEGYVLVLAFDGIWRSYDFALFPEGRDTLKINAMNLGEILSPVVNVPARLEWITFTRAN